MYICFVRQQDKYQLKLSIFCRCLCVWVWFAADEEGYDEEYPIEDIEIGASDFMARIAVPDFRRAFETIGDSNEVMETFALSFKTVEKGVAGVIKYLGMQPYDGCGTVG